MSPKLNQRGIALAAILAVPASALGCGGGGEGQGGDDIVGQSVVELVSGASIEAFNAAYGTATIAAIPQQDIYLVDLPDGMTADDLEALTESDPTVEEVEANYAGEASPDPGTQSLFVAVMLEDYLQQWATELIGVGDAHASARGAGTIVAVIDSGVDTDHPHLIDRLILPRAGLKARVADVEDIGDGLDNDGDGFIDEMVGHGTLVAGIAARVAPDARILPIRVLDDEGRTTSFQIAAAIYEAVDRGADVINVSMGVADEPDLLLDAVAYARDHDSLVVASAGNEATDDDPWSPAALRELGAIGVAATMPGDLKAPFSDFGEYVAISAPGVDIVGTLPGGRYGRASGTSFAAPIVSGTAALIRGFCPSLTATEVEGVLFATAIDIDDENPDFAGLLGAGRIDSAAAMVAVLAMPACRQLPSDLNGDQVVDVIDLVLFFGFGNSDECLEGDGCQTDLDGDGQVGILDLHVMLSQWGRR